MVRLPGKERGQLSLNEKGEGVRTDVTLFLCREVKKKYRGKQKMTPKFFWEREDGDRS